MALTYQSKPNLSKLIKSPADLLSVIDAVGLSEDNLFFEHEMKFGVLANEDQYAKIPDHLKKYFKKVSD